MDWWQRNKDFATMVGGAIGIFLVLLIVRGCVYPLDVGQTEKQVRGTVGKVRRIHHPKGGMLPSMARRLDAVEEATKRDAAVIGEIRKGEELTRALLGSVLERIGQGDSATVDEFVRLARSSPNACFSRLYDEVRRHYQMVAVEEDVPIDAALGFLVPRFSEEEITRAFHALALVTRAVDTAVHEAGVKSVDKIVVNIGRPKGRDPMESYVEMDTVTITMRTRPEGLYAILNSLNDPKRFVPIQDLKVGGGKATGQGRSPATVVVTIELAAVRIDVEPEGEN